MTYEEFVDFVKGYDEFNECVNKLYDMGMMTENCAIMDMFSYYAQAICKNFGADYAWFLNWADNKYLYFRDKEKSGVSHWVRGTEEMYEFLQSKTAREECWI